MILLVKISIIVAVFVTEVLGNFQDYDDFLTSQIILFYSSLSNELIRGQIVIYWHVPNYLPGDTLNLYFGHPDLHEIQPIFSYQPINTSGIIKTGIPPRRATYELDLSYTQQCTGYYGAWIRNNTVRNFNCLSTHPDWMTRHRNILINMTLGQIFIPGTHSSGSYSEEIPQTILQRYTVTQASTILDQLISGVRYLDLRPCISECRYWVCHGTYSMHLLDLVIDDIKEFMDHTDEIVIVSFKEFPKGFQTLNEIEIFKHYIENQFRGYYFDSIFVHRATLGQIWNSGKRLIFSYDYPFENKSLTLVPLVSQQWADAKNIQDLEAAIDEIENHAKKIKTQNPRINQLRAIMAEVTLDTSYIIADAAAYYFGRGNKALRELGIEAGPLVTCWFNQKHFETANIVAVDFVDATGIVEVAIYWNRIRAVYTLNQESN